MLMGYANGRKKAAEFSALIVAGHLLRPAALTRPRLRHHLGGMRNPTILPLRIVFAAALAAVLGLTAGCSGSPSRLSQTANDVLFRAISLVGTPYRYGGNTPQAGFDCSGLVGYVFLDAAGLRLPRTSKAIAA